MLQCLALGMTLLVTDADADGAGRKAGRPSLRAGTCGGRPPSPDYVPVTRPCVRWLRESGYVGLAARHRTPNGEVAEELVITPAGRMALGRWTERSLDVDV